ncbi:MAG: cell envelope integrity protein TolA [Mariprofundaceae bacterium]
MSLSQAARQQPGRPADPAGLNGMDLLFAVLLHALVITVIAVLAFWQQQHHSEPLKRIEVAMISAKELAKMQQQAKHKPALKHKQVAKPKIKPKPALKPKAAPKTKTPEAFDPFAPLVSSTDHKTPARTSRRELADLAGKQLSKQEMERYIALIQAAVQQKWKVPASLSHVSDPLVEMRLQPDGSVASIKLLESSGSRTLDDSLIRAIRAAAPFEVPRKQFEFFRVNRIRFHPLK